MTAVIRGKDNYMWTGSYNGLHKHEGAAIKIFNRTGKDSLSISSGEMHTVFEDKQGYIWLGTTGGLDRFDPRTNHVKHFSLLAGNKSSPHLGYIYSVFQDSYNYIWISTDVALFRMDHKTGAYKQIPLSKKDGSGVPSPVTAYKGSVNTEKGIWMHTNEGLVYYDHASQQFYHRYHNPEQKPVFNASNKLTQVSASELCIDQKKNMYFINSSSQLVRYNIETEKLDSFSFQSPQYAWKCCYSLTTDRRGNVWIGFRHGGLLFFDGGAGTFQSIIHQGINSLIRSNYIYSLAEDYLGAMWVTTNNGIDIIDWYNRSVQQIYLSEDPRFQNLHYPSGMMSYDGGRYVYLPFFKGGLFRYDTRTDSLQHFPVTDPDEQHVSFADIEKNGAVWLGNTKSLTRAMINHARISYSTERNKLSEALQKTKSSVTSIARSNNAVYVKKVNGSIYRFTGTDSLERIQGYGFMKQMNISKDSQHLLYLNRDMNVVQRHLGTGENDTIRIAEKLSSTGFLYFNPRDLVDDGNGNIWIASQNGVVRYNIQHDTVYVYTTAQGLANNFTYALCADQRKRVWVASLGGIDWYDAKRNVFKNVLLSASSTYMDSYGSAVETKDGIIFFVAGNKLYRINPDKYFATPSLPYQLALNEVQVNGETIDHADVGQLKKLSHNQNRLLFRFGLLNFTQQGDVKYHYYLEGIDKRWIENADRSVVSYNALPPGRFIFHSKATDASGNLIGKEQAISFRIWAPFWKTNWFMLLALAVIVLVMYGLYSYRQRKQREKELQKMLMAESKFMNLRLQMNPHFLFNSLNSIQHLIVTRQHGKAYQYLTVFSHLLRSILQYAEKDFITLDTELHMLKMYLDLEAMRFKDSFHYEIIVDESIDQEEVMVPSLLLQPFVENAIWHGLLNKEGDKRLTITFRGGDTCLTCTVSDNGIGREKAAEFKKQQVDPFHESKGIRIVKERLVLLEQRTGKQSDIKVMDLYHDTDPVQSAGTMVEIIIPFYYSEDL